MTYRQKIQELEWKHRQLDTEITKLEANHPGVEVVKLNEMKKQRLAYRDQLSHLRKLQWEWDHDRVELDDDR